MRRNRLNPWNRTTKLRISHPIYRIHRSIHRKASFFRQVRFCCKKNVIFLRLFHLIIESFCVRDWISVDFSLLGFWVLLLLLFFSGLIRGSLDVCVRVCFFVRIVNFCGLCCDRVRKKMFFTDFRAYYEFCGSIDLHV